MYSQGTAPGKSPVILIVRISLKSNMILSERKARTKAQSERYLFGAHKLYSTYVSLAEPKLTTLTNQHHG